MLFVPEPRIVRLEYWRDAGPMPAYERAVTDPLDVLLNLFPSDAWTDEVGPGDYYAWTRRLEIGAGGLESYRIVTNVPSEMTPILLQ